MQKGEKYTAMIHWNIHYEEDHTYLRGLLQGYLSSHSTTNDKLNRRQRAAKFEIKDEEYMGRCTWMKDTFKTVEAMARGQIASENISISQKISQVQLCKESPSVLSSLSDGNPYKSTFCSGFEGVSLSQLHGTSVTCSSSTFFRDSQNTGGASKSLIPF